MRKTLLLLALLAITVVSSLSAQTATVDRISGKVEYRLGGGGWEPAEVGLTLPLNATISTGFGASAVLNLGSSVLEVRQLTRLTIEELADNGLTADVFVPVGTVRASVNASAGRRADFRVRTPLSTASVRGTEFETNGWQLAVANGIVEFADLLNRTRDVGAGELSSLSGGSPTDPAQEADDKADIGDGGGPPDFSGGTASSGYITVRWGN
jgi:hypothetical protein